MSSLPKLGQADEPYRSINVQHDLTVEEREQRKKLIAEARIMQEDDQSGEWDYRVRGPPGNMRVVKLKKRN